MAEDGGTTDRENALLRSWPTATPAPIPASTVGLFQGSSGNALNNSTANAANRDIWNVGNVHFHLPPSHVGQGLSSLLQPLTMFSYIFSTFTGLIPRTAVTVGSPQERVPDTTTPSDPPAATPGLATALPDPTVSDAESGDAQATENIQIESGDFHITWVDDLDLEGQHQALSGTTSAEEIYVRNLYPTTHGYPCANPCTLGRPVRIGDVGELTSHGFRALKHLSDCQIPSLQSQLPLFGLSDPLHDSEYLCEGDSITGGIAGWETGFVPGSETIRSIEYRCQAFEGAILAATSPAQLHTVDSDNLRQLRLWLCKHGIDLVHLLSPGQCEPLFIVTGIVTSSSWATATYPRLMEASHGPDSLVLSRLSQELPQRYRWTRTSRQATTRSKASPSGINSQGERIKDQCLFLRGFLITPSPQHVKHQRQHALRHKDTKPMRDRGLDGSRPDVVGTQNDRGEASSENINPSSSGYQSSAPQDRADEGASQDQLLVEEFPSSCSVVGFQLRLILNHATYANQNTTGLLSVPPNQQTAPRAAFSCRPTPTSPLHTTMIGDSDSMLFAILPL
ncbi:hypothetical protein BKA70DRAFT_1411665 [Coprinopsis sp. MPI-PUGE-AT-0042]|nr:hypothetical protein BKA70DRAFT_1411665 [Coprinopsis sp. MPI-PUGE-AT-0042]